MDRRICQRDGLWHSDPALSSLLLAKTNSLTGRIVLVNGFDAQVEFDGETCWLTSQHYAPDVIHPDGASRIIKFESTPWPRWSFKLPDDLVIEQEIFIPRGSSSVVIAWKLIGHTNERVKLKVRLFPFGSRFSSPASGERRVQFRELSAGWAPHFSLTSQRTSRKGADERVFPARSRLVSQFHLPGRGSKWT